VTDITQVQLHRRKAEVLKLAVAFVYAVKHYVRDEDGLEWEDYQGLIPKAFLRPQNSGGVLHYGSVKVSPVGTGTATPERMTDSPDLTEIMSSATFSGGSAWNATKRVRVKRSIDKLTSSRTPLLGASHQNISFSEPSMPLPLMYEHLYLCSVDVTNVKNNRIAHELTRLLFAFRRDGLLETVGPAGANAMNQM
jgi:ion channel-forming bestrophin family protein